MSYETQAIDMAKHPDTIDCKSDVGLTVTLIDSIMATATILLGRDLRAPAVQEALKDLKHDQDLRVLLFNRFVK